MNIYFRTNRIRFGLSVISVDDSFKIKKKNVNYGLRFSFFIRNGFISAN